MQAYSCLHALFLMSKTKDQSSLVLLGKQNVQAKMVYFGRKKKEKRAPHFKLSNGPVHLLNSQSF